MKRALPIYAATVCALLIAGNVFANVMRSSPSNTQNLFPHFENGTEERFATTAARVARALGLDPLEWNVAVLPETGNVKQARLATADGTDESQEQRLRVLFDVRTGEVVSISIGTTRTCRPQIRKPLLSKEECRAATGAYLAKVGEILGGSWKWVGELPPKSTVYHSRWQTATRSAFAAVDRDTGTLVFLQAFRRSARPDAVAARE
jgi:hypothetical protein